MNMRRQQRRNDQNDSPPVTDRGRRFYAMLNRADGLVDVFLDGKVHPLSTEDGATDYDISFRVARGINPEDYGDLEAHIRENYTDWLDCAEVVWM